MLRIHFHLSRALFWIFVGSLAGSLWAQSPVTAIVEARGLPLGSSVTIEGEVTVPSGAFSSAMFDQGFQIQDDTAGIYVSVPNDLGFRVGDHVQVSGTVQEAFELLMLSAASTDAVSLGHSHRQIVATGKVNDTTEGYLLTVQGTISRPIENDLPFGYKVYIDDGSGELQIFIHASLAFAPQDIPFLQQGRTIRVTGTSAQFADEFEITPRFRRDIKQINP